MVYLNLNEAVEFLNELTAGATGVEELLQEQLTNNERVAKKVFDRLGQDKVTPADFMAEHGAVYTEEGLEN